MNIGDKLKAARKRAGYSTAAAAANAFGWKPSTYASHENGQTDTPPIEALQRYAKAYKIQLIELIDDNPGSIKEEQKSVSLISGKRVRTHSTVHTSIPEIDTLLGAGGGGYALESEVRLEDGSFTSEMVRAEWSFPEYFVRNELHARFEDIEILGVRGDSMIDPSGKGFRDGDRVVVHRRDKQLRQGGVFAVRDDGEVIIKQVELVRNTEPPRIICKSLNPNYSPFELVLDESAALIGRVILHLARV